MLLSSDRYHGGGNVVDSNSALLIVDVQNDFCPHGALPVPRGDEVVPVINSYIEFFSSRRCRIYATRDWHPATSKHFETNGGPWPVHCVRDTGGAQLHPGLSLPPEALCVSKGVRDDQDGYTAFEGIVAGGRGFADVLKDDAIDCLYVCGLATEYCVRSTVLDALDRGFKVTVLVDAVRGIDVKPGDSERAIREMKDKGAVIETYCEVTGKYGA